MCVIEPQAPSAQHGFRRVGAAAPATVVSFRHELTGWLQSRLDVSDERRADIVLAADEALSNAAEFAYRHGEAGDITLDVVYSAADESLGITVTDSGTWRDVDVGSRPVSRGRGLLLMEALADRVDIHRGVGGAEDEAMCGKGTTVVLTFQRCPARIT